MTFDLGAALRKKEERELARLTEFDFRCRVRATHLPADRLGLDPTTAPALVTRHDENGVIAHLADLTHRTPEYIAREYRSCLATARAQLVAERGDPAPQRLT